MDVSVSVPLPLGEICACANSVYQANFSAYANYRRRPGDKAM